MVSYADVTQLAREAYMSKLFSNEDDAYVAACEAAMRLGLGEHMSRQIADTVAHTIRQNAVRGGLGSESIVFPNNKYP